MKLYIFQLEIFAKQVRGRSFDCMLFKIDWTLAMAVGILHLKFILY